MDKKIVFRTMLTLLLIGVLILASGIQPVKASGTIYIRSDGSVDPDSAPIWSIDNVTYNFADNINDEIVVQRSNIIIDGNGYTLQGSGSGSGFSLSSTSNVTIKRTKIKGFVTGICLLRSSCYNTISGNDITNNTYGVLLDESSSNTVSGNNITQNNKDGIFGSDSHYNTISGNDITNNGYGITLLWWSSYNSIVGNSITNNLCGIGVVVYTGYITISGNDITNNGYGIFSGDSWYITISGNDITNNGHGIELFEYSMYITVSGNNIAQNNGTGIWLGSGSCYNTVSGNNVTQNNGTGIWLGSVSHNNTVSGNNIAQNNGHGIWIFYYSMYNTVSGNNIAQNNGHGIGLFGNWYYNSFSENKITENINGIWLYYSSNNTIYHNNFVDNTVQAYSESSTNVWDDGYPSGGNYWSDYDGVDLYSGPDQDQPGSDRIGDTEYIIDPMNQDRYPLMYLWGVRDVAVANVTVSATEVLQGDLVNITATVKNEGGQTETLTVTSYANSTAIGDQTVTDLAPEAEIALTFSWNTTEVYVGSYIIKAEASVVENETDTADNVYVDGTVEVILEYPPVAVVTAPTEGYVFEEIAFRGADSYDPDGGVIVGWLWDFGDGTISTEQNPLHTYTMIGTYEVTLVVTDDEGQVSDPVAHIIRIKNPQEAIQELIETIQSWDLPEGTESSLTSKLDEAILLLDKENENGAIHKLMDFINQAEALRGTKLTTEQTDYLTAEAQRIIDLIKGSPP